MISVGWLNKDEFPLIVIRKITECEKRPLHGNPVVTRNSIYFRAEDKAYILCRVFKSHIKNDGYTEFPWLIKEEIRLLSALKLSKQYGHRILDIDTQQIIIKNHQLKKITENPNGKLIDKIGSILDTAKVNISDNELKHIIMSISNKKNDEAMNPFKIHSLINTEDLILLRCLSLWLKADLLWEHDFFREEACNLLYFAIDGILKCFHWREQQLNPKISLKETIGNIEKKYGDNTWAIDYFSDCYDNRTFFVHPYNNIDYCWYPKLFADDYYDTYETLKGLLYLYITGMAYEEGIKEG